MGRLADAMTESIRLDMLREMKYKKPPDSRSSSESIAEAMMAMDPDWIDATNLMINKHTLTAKLHIAKMTIELHKKHPVRAGRSRRTSSRE